MPPTSAQPVSNDPERFDEYASNYSETLQAGLAVSGESQEFFAERRIGWVAKCFMDVGFRPDRVLDFGCGQGSSTPLLLDMLGASAAVGIDVSPGLLAVAATNNRHRRISFALASNTPANGLFDAAYTNGVVHHIPVAERAAAMKYVYDSLRPGGYFALWENNPWNPGTRYIMRRIAFDRDAITLSIPEARQILSDAGFEIVRVDSLFFFPGILGFLRRLEPYLSKTWMGAQYTILCVRPVVQADKSNS